MDALDAIRHRINAGDREGARLELVGLLKAEPDMAEAWALLAILVQDPAQQAECYRQILRVRPEDGQAAAWLRTLERQIPKARVEPDKIDRLLDALDLPDLSADAPVEEGGLLDRLDTGAWEEDRLPSPLAGDGLTQPGPLDPAVILRLAGGPLPAEQRRTCPRCGAMVARSETKCPWCSAPLPSTGAT